MGLWEYVTERRIQAAMEAGAFEHLSGSGQPFRWLQEEEYIDPEYRLTHHLLRSNGFVPDWIDEKNGIEAELETARGRLARAWNAYGRAAPGHPVWQMALALFRKQMRDLNKRIEIYNLKVPVLRLQRLLIDVEREIGRVTAPRE